jgi:hypothetical protein
MQKTGIMITSGFAAGWFTWGVSALGTAALPLVLVPVVVSGGIIAAAARRQEVATPEQRRRTGKVVGWATGLEVAAIFAANFALGVTGHTAYSACATLGLVGLHFFPLGYFLRTRAHYALGVAAVALAVAALGIGDEATRNMTVRVGAALLLWAFGLAGLAWPRRATDGSGCASPSVYLDTPTAFSK